MSQQTFANFIGINAASLSSIFNDRTRPTLNTVEAIKSKIPNLNTDWLMFGHGQIEVAGKFQRRTRNGNAQDTASAAVEDRFGEFRTDGDFLSVDHEFAFTRREREIDADAADAHSCRRHMVGDGYCSWCGAVIPGTKADRDLFGSEF